VIALGRELVRRGHTVRIETWSKWQEDCEREGMEFAAAPIYEVWPMGDSGLKPYQAAVKASDSCRALIRDFDPDAVVADILTVATSLAAQAEGRPWATLVPHVLPIAEPGFPPYSIGARHPRTRIGERFWRLFDPLVMQGLEEGRVQLNGARARVGLPPLDHLHGGISRELAIIGTFPQLEYPRRHWHPSINVTGPLMWERPYHDVGLPPGDDPLVLIAPSTAQDRDQRMLTAALEGLAGERVRVLATHNRRPPPRPIEVPPNARLVDWLSYARTMPLCDAVVCHAGHGTLVRALASGVPVVACPAAGDMAENSARVAWAGAGVSLPRRLVTPRGVRLAVRRLLGEPSYAARARELREWSALNDGAANAADLVERLASGSSEPLVKQPVAG
jgi:UDP:flavonoid glycosyltransferase YjiC (YdhE family)